MRFDKKDYAVDRPPNPETVNLWELDLNNEIRRRVFQGLQVVDVLKDEVLISGAMPSDIQVLLVLQRPNPSGKLFKAVLK